MVLLLLTTASTILMVMIQHLSRHVVRLVGASGLIVAQRLQIGISAGLHPSGHPPDGLVDFVLDRAGHLLPQPLVLLAKLAKLVGQPR